MKNITVSFIKYSNYTVSAENEEEAIKIAEELFVHDRCSPVCDISYDEVETWEED